MDTTVDLTQSEATSNPMDADGLIAGRYQLGPMLGRGAFGVVNEAVDTHTGDTVALKRLAALAPHHVERIRREVTALRIARLPGVVGLRDDGWHGIEYFIAMDRVSGSPFPGRETPCGWHDLKRPLVQLMTVLARVHFAGLIHRDLKPGNVLVAEDGTVTVLDFGIARPADEQTEHFEGTRAYAAPEQRAGIADARSDMFSVAMMAYKALNGRVEEARSNPALGLSSVPVADREVLIRMLDAKPERRPPSFVDALRALGVEPPLPRLPDDLASKATCTESELMQLFAGPEHFFHYRSDGAAALHRRTDGRTAEIVAELGSWIRTGRAYWENGQVVLQYQHLHCLMAGERTRETVDDPPLVPVERDVLYTIRCAWPYARFDVVARQTALSIDALRSIVDALKSRGLVWLHADETLCAIVAKADTPEWSSDRREGAFRALLETAEDPGEQGHFLQCLPGRSVPLDRLLAVARHFACAGYRSRAAPHIELGLTLSIAREDLAFLGEFLSVLTLDAVAAESMEALEQALTWLGRAPRVSGHDRLEGLVRAALTARSGRYEEAQRHLDGLSSFADPDLEIWRHGVQWEVLKAGPTEREAEFLDGLDEWAATTKSAVGRVLGWRADLAYRRGDFAKSYRLHRMAADRKCDIARVSSQVSLAGALLDGGEVHRAQYAAEAAINEAKAARDVVCLAYATWIWRQTMYRQDLPLTEVPEMVHAAAASSSDRGVLLAVSESAIALRRGRTASARALVVAGRRLARGNPRLCVHDAVLAAIGFAAGAPMNAGEFGQILDACSTAPPSLGAQIAGLLRMARDTPRLSDIANELATRAGGDPSVRREVLSMQEATRTPMKRLAAP